MSWPCQYCSAPDCKQSRCECSMLERGGVKIVDLCSQCDADCLCTEGRVGQAPSVLQYLVTLAASKLAILIYAAQIDSLPFIRC